MLLQLKQADVDSAIAAYVAGMGINCAVDDVTYTAGRGENGLTVDVRLGAPAANDAVAAAPAAKPAPKKASVTIAPTAAEVEEAVAPTPAPTTAGTVTGKSLFHG